MKNNSIHKILKDYNITKKTNTFIYFLSHAPIFKHFFNIDLVSEYISKEGINLAFNSLTFFKNLIIKILYFLILIVSFNANPKAFPFFFVMLTIIGVLIRKIIRFSHQDYDVIMLLKVNAKRYARYLLNYYLLNEFILMSLAITIVKVGLKINYLMCFYLVLVYLSIHIISEFIYIKKIEHRNYEVKRNSTLRLVLAVILFFLLITIVFGFDLYLNMQMTIILSLVFIPFGLLSYIKLICYNDFSKCFQYNLSIESIRNYEIMAKNYNTRNNVQLISKNMDKKLTLGTVNSKIRDKKGFEYIHAIFEKRYKIVGKSIIISNIIIICICLLSLTFPTLTEIDNNIYASSIFDGLFMLFGLIYFSSFYVQRFIVQCFFQMDRFLINYNFYRTSDAINENLKLRYKTILKINCLPMIVVSLTIFLIFTIYGKNMPFIKILIGSIFPVISFVFFPLYQISMYYLFQPYAYDGTVVNKMYKFIDIVIYVFVYILYNSHIQFTTLSGIILILVLGILSPILLVLVRLKSPKLFRVR